MGAEASNQKQETTEQSCGTTHSMCHRHPTVLFFAETANKARVMHASLVSNLATEFHVLVYSNDRTQDQKAMRALNITDLPSVYIYNPDKTRPDARIVRYNGPIEPSKIGECANNLRQCAVVPVLESKKAIEMLAKQGARDVLDMRSPSIDTKSKQHAGSRSSLTANAPNMQVWNQYDNEYDDGEQEEDFQDEDDEELNQYANNLHIAQPPKKRTNTHFAFVGPEVSTWGEFETKSELFSSIRNTMGPSCTDVSIDTSEIEYIIIPDGRQPTRELLEIAESRGADGVHTASQFVAEWMSEDAL